MPNILMPPYVVFNEQANKFRICAKFILVAIVITKQQGTLAGNDDSGHKQLH